jgi:CRP-like cAMP-binding protein
MSALLRMAKDGPEQRAIEAGEIDAIIDHASSNIILLPAARRALLEAAKHKAGGEAWTGNGLLAAVPEAERQALLAGMERVTLQVGEVLQEPGAPIRHVYFPVDCAISLRTQVEDCLTLEVGLLGREGMLGVGLALGVDVSSARAVVQATGGALRMSAARFHDVFGQSPSLQRELRRYADAKLTLARQAAACACFHSADGRLARWLLTASDLMLRDEFSVTQSVLGHLLGVRRATVNQAAGLLQQRRLIAYRRGSIRILERKGLEAAACACYASAKVSSAIR